VRFYKTPGIVSALLPALTWRRPVTENIIYLTFDDGPIPEVTEFVLHALARYNAHATFFCVGENLFKYPDIAQKVAAAGHSLGNHTYNHLKGWKTTTVEYFENIKKCDKELDKLKLSSAARLFRPPHGRFTCQQYHLIKTKYQIIMWEVLTYDFDAQLTLEVCLNKAISNTKPGSIVVLHDSLKARRNLEYVLPRYLAHFSGLGFQFKAL